jgi:hypothetical protein
MVGANTSALQTGSCQMLTEGALGYFRSLKYDPNAERRLSIMPLGGIFWVDEIPDFRALSGLARADRDAIHRLFAIRFKLWDGEELEDDDRAYWDAVCAEVPGCPVIHRVDLSPDDRKAQAAVEKETLAFADAVASVADDVSVSDDGGFVATIDLTKEESQSH